MTAERKMAAVPLEQPGVVNLTSLSSARSKMTPGEYAVDSAAGVLVVAPTGALVGDTYGLLNAIANAAGIAATHNAVPVLIAVTRAGLAWLTERDGVSMVSIVDRDSAAKRASEALDQLRSALAKVTL